MKKTLLLLPFLFLAACAHHRDVRPGANGVNRVALKEDDADSSGSSAMAQANHYCESLGKRAVVLNEGSKYTGDMDEGTYKKTKTVARVASTMGGAVAVFGGKNERNVGRVALLGGLGADAAAGKGYSYQMKFRCVR